VLFGVKVINTFSVGNNKHFYEELILGVEADSFDDAYKKAEDYIKESLCEYENPDGERVTVRAEAVDCFLSYDEENGVREVFSSFNSNRSNIPENDFYKLLVHACDREELLPLRNKDYN